MSRNADTDLLPWIMGGLMGVVAVAAIVGNAVGTLHPAAVIERAAAPKVTTSLTTSVSMSAAATDGGANAPATVTPVTVTSTTVTPGTPTLGVIPLATVIPPTPIPQSTGSELPAGQVWECVVNGQRTFSDSPCGDHPAIRQLSEVNTMAAVPVGRAPRSLPPDMNYPGVGPAYAPDVYAPGDAEEAATDSANGVAYYPLAVVPYRYGGHGLSGAPRPERRGPQNQIRPSHPPRNCAVNPDALRRGHAGDQRPDSQDGCQEGVSRTAGHGSHSPMSSFQTSG